MVTKEEKLEVIKSVNEIAELIAELNTKLSEIVEKMLKSREEESDISPASPLPDNLCGQMIFDEDFWCVFDEDFLYRR